METYALWLDYLEEVDGNALLSCVYSHAYTYIYMCVWVRMLNIWVFHEYVYVGV